jgi:hypothetical protein
LLGEYLKSTGRPKPAPTIALLSPEERQRRIDAGEEVRNIRRIVRSQVARSAK